MNVSSLNIDSAISGRYTVPAPYKAGAGGRSPELLEAIYDAPASFLSSMLAHARIMVGWAGEPKGSPVSLSAGTANPVQFTTHEFRSSGGGSFSLLKEAAIMATVPTSPYLKIEVVNGKAVIFSLHVACHFKRMHQNIVDKIEYLNCSREFFSRNFIPGTYHVYGDSLRGYYITLDGLMMLQLGLSLRTMRYYESCIEASADASAPARSARQEYSSEFEQAWQEYPKRAGGNSKSAAFKAWKARIREGIKPETMLDGVRRYAAWVRATGNTGTQFVKQAATFFGPDRHFEDFWQQPAAPGGGRQRQVDVLAGLGAMSDKFGKSSDKLTF
ncbi:TPA: ash family protein [Escherichia coli]